MLFRDPAFPDRHSPNAFGAVDDAIDTATGDGDLYCATCGHKITAPRWTISVDGAHEHRCFNPLGLQFDIRLFSDAPGVRATGAASLTATWFDGFAWRLVACGGCRDHMGWRYEGMATTGNSHRVFFGLIAEKLIAHPLGGPAP